MVDHTCPVVWASEHGLLRGSPMDESWCLTSRGRAVLRRSEVISPGLRLWESGDLSVYYTPSDWVNTGARVMLVGITPGLHQATVILHEAARLLRTGASAEDALRSANAVGSFSGPMRTNLVTTLDGIGLAARLGIDSTARFFDTGRGLVARVSTIRPLRSDLAYLARAAVVVSSTKSACVMTPNFLRSLAK